MQNCLNLQKREERKNHARNFKQIQELQKGLAETINKDIKFKKNTLRKLFGTGKIKVLQDINKGAFNQDEEGHIRIKRQIRARFTGRETLPNYIAHHDPKMVNKKTFHQIQIQTEFFGESRGELNQFQINTMSFSPR